MAGLAAAAIASSLLLIPANLRPDMPASLVLAIALASGSAVWLASLSRHDPGVGNAPDGGAGNTARAADAGGHGISAAIFSIPARFAMAAGFGLIHGLGFASALQDLHLPRAMLLSSLLGFNVGVEVGQLAVVVAAVAMTAVAARLMPFIQRRADMSAAVASAALLAAGLAWFLTRAYL